MKYQSLNFSKFIYSAVAFSVISAGAASANDDMDKFEPLRPYLQLVDDSDNIADNIANYEHILKKYERDVRKKASGKKYEKLMNLPYQLMNLYLMNPEKVNAWAEKDEPSQAGPSAPAPAKPKLPGDVSLKLFWSQNPGVREWSLNPPKGAPRFVDGDELSELNWALTLVKKNPNIKCDRRELPRNFSLKLFWKENPGVREWALEVGKFTEGNARAEMKYARIYYKWTHDAIWDPRELPARFSLKKFWKRNPGIRSWALKVGKFPEGNAQAEMKYARTYYKWNLNAIGL